MRCNLIVVKEWELVRREDVGDFFCQVEDGTGKGLRWVVTHLGAKPFSFSWLRFIG